MKILFMIPRLSYSGAPKIMSWVSNKMCEFGHEVCFITFYKSENNQILDSKIKYVQLNNKESKNWLYRNSCGMIKTIISCRKNIKKFKPDIIVSFLDSVSYVYLFLNKLFWKDKVLVSERVDPFSRKGWRAKICFYITGLANHIVFQTNEARNFYTKKYRKKSSVICNPVIMTESIKKAKKIRSSYIENTKNIALVGRLSIKQKRQDLAIKAMKEVVKKYPDYKLNIIGSGPDEQIIKGLIQEMNLTKSIILMGQKDKVPELISNYACFVLTSDYEGIPNALIEAMSIGLPCISTDCSPGGAKMLIDNSINGFIIQRNDYKELANKIIWIIKNKKKAKSIGQNASKISERYSENIIAKAWEKAIKETIK